MRGIKFRAFDKKKKEFVFYPNGIQTTVMLDGSKVLKIEEEDIEFLLFTGLKDKNGVDVYEGDIIKAYDEYETLYGIGNITFCCGCWYVEGNIHEPLFDLKRDYYFEVIGNIFENSKLLEQNNEI